MILLTKQSAKSHFCHNMYSSLQLTEYHFQYVKNLMIINCVTMLLIPLILALIMQTYFIQSFFGAPANNKHHTSSF